MLSMTAIKTVRWHPLNDQIIYMLLYSLKFGFPISLFKFHGTKNKIPNEIYSR